MSLLCTWWLLSPACSGGADAAADTAGCEACVDWWPRADDGSAVKGVPCISVEAWDGCDLLLDHGAWSLYLNSSWVAGLKPVLPVTHAILASRSVLTGPSSSVNPLSCAPVARLLKPDACCCVLAVAVAPAMLALPATGIALCTGMVACPDASAGTGGTLTGVGGTGVGVDGTGVGVCGTGGMSCTEKT